MKIVNYKKFETFIRKNNCIGPDPDFNCDDCVAEDYWDKNDQTVVACRKYFNDGHIIEYIKEGKMI